jgi:hypothetical protein
MSFEIGLLLALVIVTMVLFATDWFETDVTALGLLMTLVLTGLVPANCAFAGFGRCGGVTRCVGVTSKPFDILDHPHQDKAVQRHVKTLQPGGKYVQKALKSALKIQAQGTNHPLNSGSAFVERSIRSVNVLILLKNPLISASASGRPFNYGHYRSKMPAIAFVAGRQAVLTPGKWPLFAPVGFFSRINVFRCDPWRRSRASPKRSTCNHRKEKLRLIKFAKRARCFKTTNCYE